MIQQALRPRLVRGTPKAVKAVKSTRAATGYMLFCAQERAKLNDEPFFQALAPPKKMAELAGRWKGLSDGEKAPFQEQAAAMPKPPAAAEPTQEELPAFLPFKTEKDLDDLSKKLTDAGLTGFFVDVLKAAEGDEITIDKIGRLTITREGNEKKATKNPPVTITFKPSAPFRKKVDGE